MLKLFLLTAVFVIGACSHFVPPDHEKFEDGTHWAVLWPGRICGLTIVTSNPYPGQIFTDYDHVDRYKGVIIDYRGEEVNSENFLKVLKGDETLKNNGKKVLESGPDDNVFVFFSDHGAPNLLAFPDDNLYSDQLNNTLTWMHEHQRYKNLLIYIEACESGSMFKDVLPEHMNIYVTTSANPTESGFACFCEDPKFDVCLGDEYSIAWTKDTELHDLKKRTVREQFEAIQMDVQMSHPQAYGDKLIEKMTIGDFQGLQNNELGSRLRVMDTVNSRYAHLVGSLRRMQRSNSPAQTQLGRIEYTYKTQRANMVQMTFDYIEKAVEQHELTTNRTPRNKAETIECFRTVHEAYAKQCYTLQKVPEVANYLRKFDHMCATGVDIRSMLKAISTICS